MSKTKAKRGKTGPKPKPERETRRHTVMVRFNDDEYKALLTKCGPLRPRSTFLRERALGA